MSVEVRLPDDLYDAVADMAAAVGESVEMFMVRAAEARVDKLKFCRLLEERACRADPQWLTKFLDREGGEPPQPGDELPEGDVRTR